jgi:hypothetical protein
MYFLVNPHVLSTQSLYYTTNEKGVDRLAIPSINVSSKDYVKVNRFWIFQW